MKHRNVEEEKEELARIEIPYELREILEKEIKNKTIEFLIEGELLVLQKNRSKTVRSVNNEIRQTNNVCIDNIGLSPEENVLLKHLLRKKRQSYSKEESKFIWKR
ncbi:hypothetical protein [Priestia megaterium]|uniref:hypothetical protein n=1 Tax=Priestia megaterium TaxID=1404 RepID=UPI0012B888EE|nr:hypothetical protein [Priestia megaterium]NGY85550.1 hypothetical protein [Priestia megaterium]